MPSSNATAAFTFKNFKGALPPADSDIGVTTILRKKHDDLTFSLQFSDASLKDPRSGQGILISAEKPLGEGVKGALTYDVNKRSATGIVTLDKPINGSNLQLRAIYKQAGDVFILDETWKFDANNKLSGSYNFSTEEALFAYTYSKDDWSATARYNFQKDSSAFEVSKKQGKQTYAVAYAPKDETALLSWSAKPFRASLKAQAGLGGVKATQATFTVTHEFDL